MSDAERLYSFRVLVPDVLQRERAQTVALEVYRDGVLSPVTAAGSTFTLIDEGGTSVIDAQPITVSTDGIAQYAVSALELPSTLNFSELYQERWHLILEDGTARDIRREAAVAPFLIYLPVSDRDLMDGEYPGLTDELGQYGSTLQPFIDRAFRDVLEELWKKGQWPDLMLSTSAFVKPIREKALFHIFKFLFRHTGGGTGQNRWQTLMDYHKNEMDGALADFRSRIDHDIDGLPDTRDRESSASVVQRNAHFNRRLRRSSRW